MENFDRYYQTWYPAVYRYFSYRGLDPDGANDLASQVFERAYRAFGTFNPAKGDFPTWLFAIARNTAASHWSAAHRRAVTGLDQAEYTADPAPLPEDQVAGIEQSADLMRALAALEERERELVAMKFAGRMTNRQIAALTGLTESNVGVILYRALHRVRRILAVDAAEVNHAKR